MIDHGICVDDYGNTVTRMQNGVLKFWHTAPQPKKRIDGLLPDRRRWLDQILLKQRKNWKHDAASRP